MAFFKILFVIFSLIFYLNSIDCCAAKTCESGWVFSGGKCYKLIEDPVSHDEINCQIGSFAIENENEAANLPSMIKSLDSIWVNAKANEASEYKWSNGNNLLESSKLWCSNSPSMNQFECVILKCDSKNSNCCLEDHECLTSSFKYVCAKPF